MRCPSCGAKIADDALECPTCHAAVDVTRKISLSGASWCPSCGALVRPGAEACPSCGASLRRDAPRRRTRDLDLPEIGNTGVMDAIDDAAGRTGSMTRIESAIPPSSDEESPSARRDRMPRPRAFAFAALFAVVIVGGAALLITHPWDPSATQTRAKEPADTSMSGFPGFVESLTGQDVGPGSSTSSVDLAEQLTSLRDDLKNLSSRADESEGLLREVGVSGTPEERSSGLEGARQLSLDVSNTVSSISELSGAGSAYDESASGLLTLANWLRNRCDALTEAWERAAASEDPSADRDSILAPLSEAADYARLFSEEIDDWSPSTSE